MYLPFDNANDDDDEEDENYDDGGIVNSNAGDCDDLDVSIFSYIWFTVVIDET